MAAEKVIDPHVQQTPTHGVRKNLEDVARLRVAQLVLLVVVVVALALATAVTLFSMNKARERYDRDAAIATRLIDMREQAHFVLEEFLRRQAAGEKSIPWAIVGRMQTLAVSVSREADEERRIDPGSPQAAAARRTMAEFDVAIKGARDFIIKGQGRDVPLPDSTRLRDATVVRFFAALRDWTTAGQQRAAASLADQNARIRTLVMWMAALLTALLVGAVLVYRLFGRAQAHLVRGFAETAAEQSALRRVATAAAESDDVTHVFETIAEEVRGLLGADAGWLDQIDNDRATTVAQTGSPKLLALVAPASADDPRGAVHPDSVRGRAMSTGEPARVADYNEVPELMPKPFRDAGVRTSIAAPVVVDGRPWGVIVVVAGAPEQLPEGCEERLMPFARLAGVAIENAEARHVLAERASTDPLTLLPNHGAFQQRLAEETMRARDAGRHLGLVVMDVDHFKAVNDTFGHPVGDRVLGDVARRLRELVRDGEMLARTGGEEFAWILPGTDRHGATAAGERAREAIRGAPFDGVGVVTLSAGTCDLDVADDPHDLLAKADQALLAAKAQGRDRTVAYDVEATRTGTSSRAARFEQARALEALHALARAVDARHADTMDHAHRVADVATDLARGLGWERRDVDLMRDAALLHDVGRVGRPVEAAGAAGADHAALGAQLLADVLTPLQARWVGGHLDPPRRPDSTSDLAYEGTHVLAAADVWDGLLHGDGRRAPLPFAAALRTLHEMGGERIDAAVVAALTAELTATMGTRKGGT